MTAFRTRVAALCLAGMAFASPVAAQQAQPAQPTQPQDVLKATHGAWEVRCIEGTEICAMQQIGSTAAGERALQVTVERLADVTSEGRPVPAELRVRTPLGVLIPYAVRVQIDAGDEQQLPLWRCLPGGCVARAPMSEEAINLLKKGATAEFTFVLTEEVPVDISLNGFTAAYNALTPIEPQAQPQAPAQN